MLTQEEIKVAAAQARKYPPGNGRFYMVVYADDGIVFGVGKFDAIISVAKNASALERC